MCKTYPKYLSIQRFSLSTLPSLQCSLRLIAVLLILFFPIFRLYDQNINDLHTSSIIKTHILWPEIILSELLYSILAFGIGIRRFYLHQPSNKLNQLFASAPKFRQPLSYYRQSSSSMVNVAILPIALFCVISLAIGIDY